MDNNQIEVLKEVAKDLEHIADNGGIMISGLMANHYYHLKNTIEEIIDENE